MSEHTSSQEEIELLLKLFNGRRDAYGVAKGNVERNPKGDWNGVFWEALAERHLVGAPNADLGVYLVRDDDTVTYCCVDIDEPDFDLAKEVAETMPSEYVWVEESRSGNFHVWVFFDEPLEAWAARAVLRGVVVAVGQPALELFPKQDRLRSGMVGNYVSIPWHGEERPIVWGKIEGDQEPSPVDRATWLVTADKQRTSAEAWRRRGKALGGRPRSETRSEEFGERRSLHVCAEHIFANRNDNPLVPGHRAAVLFALAKMYSNCALYSEEETIQLVQEVNATGSDPIPEREVRRFVRNAIAGQWTSTGCDDPLVAPYVSPDCKILNAA